jgi:hypothetical protein
MVMNDGMIKASWPITGYFDIDLKGLRKTKENLLKYPALGKNRSEYTSELRLKQSCYTNLLDPSRLVTEPFSYLAA